VGVLEHSIFLQVYIAETKTVEEEAVGFGDGHAVEFLNSDNFLLFLHVLHCFLDHAVRSLNVEGNALGYLVRADLFFP